MIESAMKSHACAVVTPIFMAVFELERPFADKSKRLNIPESEIGGREIETVFGSDSAMRSR